MFAVIKTGGKQYRVAAEDVITVATIAGEPGSAITFDQVLMVTNDSGTQVGAPVVAPLAAGVCVFALALTVVAAGRVRVDLVVAARAVSGRARTAAAAVTAPVAAPLAVAVVVSRGLRLGQSAVRVARGGSTHVASRASST